MIASRSGASGLPRVVWRREAKRSLNRLMNFLADNGRGDPKARRAQIIEAAESLRHAPLRCEVAAVRDGLTFRRLVVDGRFFVYYVYNPPRGILFGGIISIRSVKHAAVQNPFLGVREACAGDQPHSVLRIRDTTDPAIA